MSVSYRILLSHIQPKAFLLTIKQQYGPHKRANSYQTAASSVPALGQAANTSNPVLKPCPDAGLGRAATWKSSIQQNAAAMFSRRSADMQSYVYGAPATDPTRGRGVAKQQVSHCLLSHLHVENCTHSLSCALRYSRPAVWPTVVMGDFVSSVWCCRVRRQFLEVSQEQEENKTWERRKSKRLGSKHRMITIIACTTGVWWVCLMCHLSRVHGGFIAIIRRHLDNFYPIVTLFAANGQVSKGR